MCGDDKGLDETELGSTPQSSDNELGSYRLCQTLKESAEGFGYVHRSSDFHAVDCVGSEIGLNRDGGNHHCSDKTWSIASPTKFIGVASTCCPVGTNTNGWRIESDTLFER